MSNNGLAIPINMDDLISVGACPGCGTRLPDEQTVMDHLFRNKLVGKDEKETWRFIRQTHGTPVPAPVPVRPLTIHDTQPLPIMPPYVPPPPLEKQPAAALAPIPSPSQQRMVVQQVPYLTHTATVFAVAQMVLTAVMFAMVVATSGLGNSGPFAAGGAVLSFVWQQPALAFGLACGAALGWIVPSYRKRVLWAVEEIAVWSAVALACLVLVTGAVTGFNLIMWVMF